MPTVGTPRDGTPHLPPLLVLARLVHIWDTGTPVAQETHSTPSQLNFGIPVTLQGQQR